MTSEQHAIEERIGASFAKQGLMATLGASLGAVAPGFVEIVLIPGPAVSQQHGFVHGGVISYLADNALTFAGALALGPRVVTGEYKINYLRPAVNGTLVARAKLVYAGRHQATCQCHVFVIDGDHRGRRRQGEREPSVWG